MRFDGESALTEAGMLAPVGPPTVTPSATAAYYVARTDVTKPGAVYFRPPSVTFEYDCGPAPAGFRPASARAYLEQSSLSEIDTEDGGKYYPCEPTVELSGTHGSGASIKAELDSPAVLVSDPNNSRETGLTGFALVSDGPPWPDEQALPDDMSAAIYSVWEYVDIPVTGNGIQRVTGPRRWFSTTNTSGGISSYFIEMQTDVEILGYTSGAGAVARITATGHQYLGADCSGNVCFFNFRYATGFGDAVPYKMGKDYAADAEVMIAIPAVSVFDPAQNQMVAYDFNAGANTKTVNALHWQKAIVIRAYSGSDPRNPGGGTGYPIRELILEGGGSGYLVAPQIKIISTTGFGAYATCTVRNGSIDTVTLENGGGGYKTTPEVKILSGGAEAFAVARPHLRGLYQCYYRYTDDTAEDVGGPIPSNLSEVFELDAGDGTAGATWTVAPPLFSRSTHIELWRTTGGQATTVYRVARLPTATASGFFDDLTDDELRDPDRDGYAAMPILLPNGELNANRFGPPPNDKSVVVRFQDRMWYGVGGELPNAIYYSETDEPESVPEENEIIVQQNDRDFDRLQALIPFGPTLFLAQDSHLLSLTFSQIPVLDGQISTVAYRGCLNQRCWQIHEGYAYIADRYGIFRMNLSGAVESLTEAVHDEFESSIDFRNTTWNFMSLDKSTKTLRYFHVHRSDGAGPWPTRALCIDVTSGAIWHEKYPLAITSSAEVALGDGRRACACGSDGGLCVLDAGQLDVARGAIASVLVTDRGRGFRHPPSVNAVGGFGARLQASLNQDGEVAAIWILDPGFGYQNSELVIAYPDDPSIPASERRPATAILTATPLDQDTGIFPTFHFKTGCVEYPSDADDKSGGQEQRRDTRIYYKPTAASNELSLRMYYNNSPHPRANVAERDRGTGFVDSVVDPAARLDLGYQMEQYGQDSGAARAIRTGKTLEDVRSGDRDVAIEVCGPSRAPDPVSFFSIDVFGGAQ